MKKATTNTTNSKRHIQENTEVIKSKKSKCTDILENQPSKHDKQKNERTSVVSKTGKQ